MPPASAADMEKRLGTLLSAAAQAAKGGTVPADLPIVASEPEGSQGAVSEKGFYLMPILAMQDPFDGVKFLRVASIDPGDYAKNKNGGKKQGRPKPASPWSSTHPFP